MQNIEKKELLKILEEVIKNDRKENLLQLIENGIIDERMCKSRHLEVREELFRNRYFIDILVDDEDKDIRYKVYEWLIKNNKLEQKYVNLAIQQDDYDVLSLFIENGVVDERMCKNYRYVIREELAENGYFANILIKDESETITYKAYKWLIENHKLEQHHIDYAIQQDDYDILLLLIKSKIIDKRMCQSQHYYIREELAKKGYFIDILINDQDSFVRRLSYDCLIEDNKLEQKHIDCAIQQEDEDVLCWCVKNGIIDERMCQSEHYNVRKLLVNNGYFIDILINDNEILIDNNKTIKNMAYKWLVKNNKLEQKHIDKLLFDKDYETLQFLVSLNYENELINKEKILKKIKEFQARNEDNISLLINNKEILKKQ